MTGSIRAGGGGMTEVRERELRIRRRTSDGMEARWTGRVGSAAMKVSSTGELGSKLSEVVILVGSVLGKRVGEFGDPSAKMCSTSFRSKGLAAIDLNKEVS